MYLGVVTILPLALILVTLNLFRRGNSFGEFSAGRINVVEIVQFFVVFLKKRHFAEAGSAVDDQPKRQNVS